MVAGFDPVPGRLGRMRYAVIMAGGSGKRLWPLSRQGEPKQLLPLFNGRSLLQKAWGRVRRLLPPEQILVCTGAGYADRVVEQLPELVAENLLGEPVGRDSLNAVGWSAAVLQERDPDAVVAMVTADQLIEPVSHFVTALDEGFRLAGAHADALVCFGVIPDSPHTGYGYLERGEDLDGFGRVSRVACFHEKPDEATAQRYLDSGRYWWNAGIFVWRAATFMDQLRQLMPNNHDQLRRLAADPGLVAEIFPTLTRISVDYGVLEPVSHGQASAQIYAVAMDITWADVGNYATLHAALSPDEEGNVSSGAVSVADVSGSMLINTDADTVVAAVGVHDLAIVRTPRVTLVADLASSQAVKTLAEEVAQVWGEDLG